MQVDAQLREQEFGNLQGDDFQKFREQQSHIGRFYYRFPTGESGADVYDRTKQWWYNDLLRVNLHCMSEPVDNVVVVTHGLTMRFILMVVNQWSPRSFESIWNAKNCAMWVLKKDLSLPGPSPYRLDTEEGDKVTSTRCVCVFFRDGTKQSLVLEDYLTIQPPRTRRIDEMTAMLAAQHGIVPETVERIDIDNCRSENLLPMSML